MNLRHVRVFLSLALLAQLAMPAFSNLAAADATVPPAVAPTVPPAEIKLTPEQREAIKQEIKSEVIEEFKAELKAQLAEEAKAQAKPDPAGTGIDPLTKALSYIERLPQSAYPSVPVRGIPGGSLITTFQGLQWPYYPKTGIAFSGYAWLDSGYETIHRGNPAEQSIDYWLQQGRLLLRVTPTYSRGRFFVQAQAELVANKDQSQAQPNTVDTDDMWIKVGMWNLWDLQLGRYEGWEVYHFGMGLDLYTLERNGAQDDTFTAPAIYGVTYAFYRPAGVGQAAFHLYATKYLRFELGSQFGNEFGSNTIAGRPVAVFDWGWIKIKAGLEYKKLSDQKEGSKGQTTERGLGGSVQFIWNPRLEFGANFAYGLTDRIAQDGTVDETGSNTTWSVGGFANVRIIENLVVGGGYNYTYLKDLHFDPSLNRAEEFNHTQTFVAVQYILFQQLYIKAVGAYAKAEFAPTFGDPIFKNDMYSARLRLQFVF